MKRGVAASTSGQKDLKVQAGKVNSAVKAGISVTPKSLEVSTGVETKVGDTKVSEEVFIKVNTEKKN